MRTTVQLDDDVLQAARAIARLERRGVGRVLSDLARRGLSPAPAAMGEEGAFPVFRVPPGAPPITDEAVAAALDDE